MTALNVLPSKLLDVSVPKHSFSHASPPLSIHPLSMSTIQHTLPLVHIIISSPAPLSAKLPASPQPISISRVDLVPVEASEADPRSMAQITKTSATQPAAGSASQQASQTKENLPTQPAAALASQTIKILTT
ncbi:hypothetical protein O181_000949 [Austropuccinia psidii MF-1]|uniref:Uncharacterized protein n=1 Tax=Austropuccinia psidii MF-1 TaxID=1389203 RepID=A0A9Q3B9J7_9BASI|nr:hypothetical protein [Austropuccinia psidii MF-1]